jgi:L-malate glycosyltransferase
MTKLNIFFVHASELITDHLPHGDGLIAFGFLEALAERGHQVYVAVERSAIRGRIPSNLHLYSIHREKTDSPRSRIMHLLRSRLLFNRLSKNIRFDIVHQTNPVHVGMSLAVLGCDVSLVMGPYEPDWPQNPNSAEGSSTTLRDRARELCKRVIWECQHIQADRIILSSPAALEKFRWPDAHRSKISYLPFGIDVDRFKPIDRTPAQRILFLAHVHRMKGIFVLLEAFEKVAAALPNAELVVAGPAGDLTKWQHRVRSSPNNNRIHFRGEIGRESVPSVIADCDVYCLPSLGEPFGMTALEAMACGRPVVGSDAGGLGWLIEEQGGRKVPKNDPEGLADALIDVLSDQERMRAMRAFNRNRAVSRYSWPKIIDQLEEIYWATISGRAETAIGKYVAARARFEPTDSQNGWACSDSPKTPKPACE